MLAPLLLLAMTVGDSGKGSSLYHLCKDFVAITEEQGVKNPGEILGAGRCLGYVDGFIQGSYAHPFACPGDATALTIIRVYIAYMDKNPKLFDELEGVTLVFAMQDAYPCPSK